MKSFWHNLYAKHSFIYKILLCIAVSWSITYLLPKGNRFSYEFHKGKPWLYQTLYAPFDFPIKKSHSEIVQQEKNIAENSPIYYTKDSLVYYSVSDNYTQKIIDLLKNKISEDSLKTILYNTNDFLKQIYKRGIISQKDNFNNKEFFLTQPDGIITNLNETPIVHINHIQNELKTQLPNYQDFHHLLSQFIKPNIFIDNILTDKVLKENLKSITHTRGFVKKNQLIIAKGQIIEGEKWILLKSLQAEYELNNKSNLFANSSFYGYFLLITGLIFIIILYLFQFHFEIYENNSKVTLILLNILLIVSLVSFTLQIDETYIYAIPICLIPLVLKAFFENRVGIFIYIITILITAFVVSDSFEYIFINTFLLIVLLLNNKQTHYRIGLFVTAGYITLTYIFVFIIYNILLDNNHKPIEINHLTIFIINGFLLLFSQPLIYVYEKLFGLVSDISLLELTDTNSHLLRELSEKAPGTFHHCLQVANLAEAAAKEIGANTLLARVGALYHDIGKVKNPMYFTENQKTSVNLHDELTPKESAKIIINHVIQGIEIARKNNIPDRIIDFIRTHHGNSLVYYFYKKQLESNEPFNEDDFRYKGPIPFSKETLILMMADSVEAASKSLKTINTETIDSFVESIIKKQLNDGQYLNANITLKEIEKIKKVFKEKLINIYHLRIEYPE